MGYRVFPGGKERPGREADPSPPSSAVGHERVELYLYFTYGLYLLLTTGSSSCLTYACCCICSLELLMMDGETVLNM